MIVAWASGDEADRLRRPSSGAESAGSERTWTPKLQHWALRSYASNEALDRTARAVLGATGTPYPRHQADGEPSSSERPSHSASDPIVTAAAGGSDKRITVGSG